MEDKEVFELVQGIAEDVKVIGGAFQNDMSVMYDLSPAIKSIDKIIGELNVIKDEIKARGNK